MYIKLKIKNIFLKSRQYIVVAFIFLFLIGINTFPVFLDLANYEMGDGGDSYQNMWNFWWFKTAVMDLHQNPYFTDYLFYPHNASLILHTLSPIEGLISIPLQYLFGGNLVLVFNLIVINSFWLTSIFTYALVYYLTKNKFASFLSSYILVFSPYMMGHGLGHLNLIAIQWIPAFLLSFFIFHEKQSIKSIIFSSIFLSLIIVTNSYQTVFLLLFIFIYLIFNILNKNIKLTKNYLFKLTSIFALTLFLIFPFIYGYVTAFFSGLYHGNHNVTVWTPDIVMFLIPGKGSTWIKLLFDYLVQQEWVHRVVRSANFGSENEIYFGYSLLILMFFGLYKVKTKEIWMWFITFITFLVLALGVTIKFIGYVPGIKLPYYYIYEKLPLVSVPGRFDLFIVFSLAMIAGYVIVYLSNVLSSKKQKIIFTIIFLLIFLDFQQIPYRTHKLKIPDIYYQFSQDTEDYAIFDISRGNWGIPMYLQTIHKKKLLNAYISRSEKRLSSYLETEPIISDIFNILLERDINVNSDWTSQAIAKLSSLKVKYVIFSQKQKEVIPFNVTPYFIDDSIIVYKIY